MRYQKPQSSNQWRFDAFHLFTVFEVLLIFGLWIIHVFIAERTAPTSFLLYVPPQPLMFLPIIGALWALLRKRPKILVTQLVTFLFTLFILCNFQIPQLPSTHNSPKICVVTWNVLLAGQGGRADGIAQKLKEFNADIICLQETRGANAANFQAALRHAFPDWNFAAAGDVITLLRFPITQQSEYAGPEPSKRFVLDTTLQIGSRKLRVLNTHWSTVPLAFEKKPWPGGSSHMRSLQAKQLFQLTEKSAPFVIAGDFNNPPRGRIYARMTQRWRDAFVVRGVGFGGTYPAHFSLLRIDYIWTSPQIRVLNCYTVKSSLSNHRVLVSDVSL